MSKKSPNHTLIIGEKTKVLYPNFHDFESGQEPAIIVIKYNDSISLSQGDQDIQIPEAAIKDLCKLMLL